MLYARIFICLFIFCFLSCKDKTLNEFDVVNKYINTNLKNTECIKSDCNDLFKWKFIKKIENDSLHILIYAFKGENCDCLRVKREINLANHTVISFGVRKNTLKLIYLESGVVMWDLTDY